MVQDCHTRLAHDAITPMTHLFLKIETILEGEGTNILSNVQRTGTAATLLDPSYCEPETIKVFNELFLLLNNPALDHLFKSLILENLRDILYLLLTMVPLRP